MSEDGLVIRGIPGLVPPPGAGIHSLTLHQEDGLRVVAFGFAAGERLTEHTASRTAIVQVLAGRLTVTLAGEPHEVGPGDWIRMAPGLAHAVDADGPAVMLLTLLGPGAVGPT
jgi:quercetin dioxygenase-like cupin family protein